MPSLSNHKRFYVYALVDPRDDAMFYIGKGTGKRKSAHTELVRKGRWDSNGVKCERIEAILVAKSPFEWILDASNKQIEAVTHTWGGHEAALVWFAGSLRELEADLL
jgi:hypothetical protein